MIPTSKDSALLGFHLSALLGFQAQRSDLAVFSLLVAL